MDTLPDDYRELMESARDALGELLDVSHHDSLTQLRESYGTLRRAVEEDDELRRKVEERKTAAQRREQQEREIAEQRELQYAWRRYPRERRESLLLHALGEDRLTLGELTARLNRELTPSGSCLSTVYETHVRALAMSMLKAGQLERIPEPFRGKLRYRFLRCRGLDGPIADLERALQDDGAES